MDEPKDQARWQPSQRRLQGAPEEGLFGHTARNGEHHAIANRLLSKQLGERAPHRVAPSGALRDLPRQRDRRDRDREPQPGVQQRRNPFLSGHLGRVEDRAAAPDRPHERNREQRSVEEKPQLDEGRAASPGGSGRNFSIRLGLGVQAFEASLQEFPLAGSLT